ncbi:MAG TPA: GntR family transcriptional regulator [Acidimicrobiales bacterium]
MTITTPHLQPLERRPTATVIAEAIRERIIDGSFTPGTQLTEMQLANQLDVSRGPVREALQRLIQEGLLVSEPHRGVFVVRLDRDDMADVYVARAAVEREAARQIVRRNDRAIVQRLGVLVAEMAEAAKTGSWADVADADLRFHEALVAASGSRRLQRMYATLLAETRLCLTQMPRTEPNARTVVAEHRALVKALRAGDEVDVVARIDAHLGLASRHEIR